MKTAKLRETIKGKGAAAALICGEENVRYYSGFQGDSSQLLITGDAQYLFTDFRYTEQAENETDFIVIETGGAERLKEIFSHVSGSIGVDLSGVTYPEYQALLGHIDSGDITDISNEVLAQREVKDETELSAIRKGAAQNDKLFTHICGLIKPGMTENDVKAEIIYYMNRHGADSAFAPIVASGENSSLPHATPSDRVIQPGDFVTMDLGCKYGGYCSDFTRTVAISDVDKDMQTVYDIVNIAGQKALEAARPGMKAKALDVVARDYIEARGYGEAFGHGLGHGVGRDVHEGIRLNALSETVLVPGMVITIEPGIYLKGRFGVRIEDLCVITEDGCENFTHAPRELIVI